MGLRKSEPRRRRDPAAERRDPPGSVASQTDEVLLAGVKRGSELHFNALYARYFGRIFGFMRQRVRIRADAEELTQEVFTAVFRSAGGFGARASALAWIYGVARNTLFNHLRRQQFDRVRLEQLTPAMLAPPAPEYAYTPEEQVRLDRLAAAVQRRISGVAPWQLDAFHLRHVENLPIEEISRRTTRSADAVRSGLYRVKRLLLEVAGDEEAKP